METAAELGEETTRSLRSHTGASRPGPALTPRRFPRQRVRLSSHSQRGGGGSPCSTVPAATERGDRPALTQAALQAAPPCHAPARRCTEPSASHDCHDPDGGQALLRTRSVGGTRTPGQDLRGPKRRPRPRPPPAERSQREQSSLEMSDPSELCRAHEMVISPSEAVTSPNGWAGASPRLQGRGEG